MRASWMAAGLLMCLTGGARGAEIRSVVIVGNSITRHTPAEKLGWPHDHGMAATSPESDFAHLLFARITAKLAATQAAPPTLSTPKGVVVEKDWSSWTPEKVADADLLIFAVGDNFRRSPGFEARRDFIEPYTRMVKDFSRPGRLVLCVSNWGDPGMSKWIEEGARAAGVLFVDIAPLGKDPANKAASEGQFTHAGVNGHPGDRGMALIAETIWKTLEPALDARATDYSVLN